MELGLHNLWEIDEESFRELVQIQLYRHSPSHFYRGSEASCPMPGDELLPEATEVRMRGIEIQVEPEQLWPWLGQMMRGGGIYGWARLESPTCRSADHLLDGLPPPASGDRLGTMLELAVVEPGRGLVWTAQRQMWLFGHQLDDLTLDYRLERLGPDRSQLRVRVRIACPHLTRQIAWYLADAIDLLLPLSQLEAFSRLCVLPARRHEKTTNPGRHQVLPLHPAPNPSPSGRGWRAQRVG